MTGIFEALGEPVRRRLLELLVGAELPAGVLVDQIREEVPISQPAVSQHLKVLRDARLVTVRADGRRRLYRLDSSGIDAAQVWLARLAQPFGVLTQPLDALATEVARGKRSRRQGGGPVEQVEAPEQLRPQTGTE